MASTVAFSVDNSHRPADLFLADLPFFLADLSFLLSFLAELSFRTGTFLGGVF
jgi:hypothetical protein